MPGKHAGLKGDGWQLRYRTVKSHVFFLKGRESWAVGSLRAKSPGKNGFSTDGVDSVC